MREDKLIRGMSESERSLTLAIRRAAGDESALLKMSETVANLVTDATKTRDPEQINSVDRLLAELRAAVSGSKVHRRPIIETKDCAAPLQHREFKFASSRARAEREFGGYGSTFNGEPDSYNDIILPGAFRKSLAAHRTAGTLPKLFWAHASHLVPGRWLDMSEDSHGLVAEGRLSKTSLGNDLDVLIQDGAVDALSIGFSIPEGGARWDSKGVRIISEIEVFEVSLVSLPANPRARLTPGKSADPVDKITAALAKLRTAALEIEKEEKRGAVVVPFRSNANSEEAALAKLAEQINRLNRLMRA